MKDGMDTMEITVTTTKQAAQLKLGAELRPIRQSRSIQGYLHAPRPPSRQLYSCQVRSSGRLNQSRSFQGYLHAPQPPSRPIRQSRSDCMHYGHQVGSFTFVRRGAQADQIEQERLGVFACTTATKQAALLLLGTELRPIRQSRSVDGYLHAPRPPSRPIRQSRSDCMHYGHQVGSFTFVRRRAQANQIEQEHLGVFACTAATKQADQIEQE